MNLPGLDMPGYIEKQNRVAGFNRATMEGLDLFLHATAHVADGLWAVVCAMHPFRQFNDFSSRLALLIELDNLCPSSSVERW